MIYFLARRASSDSPSWPQSSVLDLLWVVEVKKYLTHHMVSLENRKNLLHPVALCSLAPVRSRRVFRSMQTLEALVCAVPALLSLSRHHLLLYACHFGSQLRARPWAYFMSQPHNPIKQSLVSPFSTWESGRSERLRDLPQWQSRYPKPVPSTPCSSWSPPRAPSRCQEGKRADLSPRQPEERGWSSLGAAHLGCSLRLVSWAEAQAWTEAAAKAFQMDFPCCLKGEVFV